MDKNYGNVRNANRLFLIMFWMVLAGFIIMTFKYYGLNKSISKQNSELFASQADFNAKREQLESELNKCKSDKEAVVNEKNGIAGQRESLAKEVGECKAQVGNLEGEKKKCEQVKSEFDKIKGEKSYFEQMTNELNSKLKNDLNCDVRVQSELKTHYQKVYDHFLSLFNESGVVKPPSPAEQQQPQQQQQ